MSRVAQAAAVDRQSQIVQCTLCLVQSVKYFIVCMSAACAQAELPNHLLLEQHHVPISYVTNCVLCESFMLGGRPSKVRALGA